MVKIRLSRQGSRNNAFYRIVVTDKKRKLSGKVIEVLGYWYPTKNNLEIDRKRFTYWQSVGAQATKTVLDILNG